MLRKFARAITSLNRVLGEAASWLIIVLFLLLITDVIYRYVVGRPTVWTSELSQLLFGVYAVLGGGYLLAQRGHVNVDILYGSFSRRSKALTDVATSFLFFLFVGVLLWQGWSLAADSIERLERTQSIWNPPVWPVKLAIPIAAILLLLQGVVRLIGDVLILLGRGDEVDEASFGLQQFDGEPK
jgi:TRAP-type mannitol/chloroaromatic compound transport system permease small subunit